MMLVADHHGFGFMLQAGIMCTDAVNEPPIIGLVEQRSVSERYVLPVSLGQNSLGLLKHFPSLIAVHTMYPLLDTIKY